jgi:hypothetical protein
VLSLNIEALKAEVRLRIIIVGIRHLGNCPCPRCIIPMDRVHNMGKYRDMSQRVSLAQDDDVHQRSRIEAARQAIYERNIKLDGAAVERLLSGDSLVPAAVSVSPYFNNRC